ncbi:MAG TPA: exodeoxyribonuclease VII large subunit [Accumulibacter sp.]|nr:exodeoxyribonuclease VII large subunit [Accumulibacter sp.]HMW16599.1 exodeoxyribonuclease VII large subunit [Accumulibacter sp.]HMY07271.1 exodeoxyribonuclease VII large subunit [Accumulibacter sp.]HNC17471.1 exodeoxyribonuclease VII large subunit [Accumulibacter sp.]HND79184.1 exodeoxyribonuclease VII large subunit [Accumulibacter sp.]
MFDAPDNDSLAALPPVISVTLLNRLARERLEAVFPLCWITGEVSNLTYAASGHVYFSLKDHAAQVRCAMFRHRAQLLGWRLANGQHLEVRAQVTLYEARGDFQLTIDSARQAGIGNLYEQFLRLKDKLAAEGLFAAETKRSLRAFPRRIGIVTSPQAAALRDVLTTLRRRASHVAVIIYPTPVQGQGAAAQIAEAIRRADSRNECDVLLICRGGGSLEDLWAFNDEILARTIRACSRPVISGIGHETDFTIADFVADRRAPTPTAAAEIAAPERRQLLAELNQRRTALRRQCWQQLNQRGQQIDGLARRLQAPAHYLTAHRQRLHQLRRQLALSGRRMAVDADRRLTEWALRLRQVRPSLLRQRDQLEYLRKRLCQVGDQALANKSGDLARLAEALSHLDPRAVLTRGYSIVTDEHGAIIRDSNALEPLQRIAVFFERGQAQASVLTTTDDELPVVAADVARPRSGA